MSHSAVNPPSPDLPTRGLVRIAGQYGARPEDSVTPIGFADQVEQAFTNLGTALAANGLEYIHVARLGTYLVGQDAEDLVIVDRVIARIWGDRPPVRTLLGVAALPSPELRFEVDALAVRP